MLPSQKKDHLILSILLIYSSGQWRTYLKVISLDFHLLRIVSILPTRRLQFLSALSSLPKKMPRILRWSLTQVKSPGLSDVCYHDNINFIFKIPIHFVLECVAKNEKFIWIQYNNSQWRCHVWWRHQWYFWKGHMSKISCTETMSKLPNTLDLKKKNSTSGLDKK